MDYSKIQSPCYVLDEVAFRNNLELIKSVKDRAGVEIILAFKAFAMWSAFPIVREYIPYSTASSLAEARLAFEEMGSPAHTYGPAYTDREFPEIVKCSSHITFNSLTQFERLYPQTQFYNVSCGLRINPEFSMSKPIFTILVRPVQGWVWWPICWEISFLQALKDFTFTPCANPIPSTWKEHLL